MKSKWGEVNHTKKIFLKILRWPKFIIWTKLTIHEVKSKKILFLPVLLVCVRNTEALVSQIESETCYWGRQNWPYGKHAQWNKHPFLQAKHLNFDENFFNNTKIVPTKYTHIYRFSLIHHKL